MSFIYDETQTPAQILLKLCHAYNALLLSGNAGVASVSFGGNSVSYTKGQLSDLLDEIRRRHSATPIQESYSILGVSTKPVKGQSMRVFFG